MRAAITALGSGAPVGCGGAIASTSASICCSSDWSGMSIPDGSAVHAADKLKNEAGSDRSIGPHGQLGATSGVTSRTRSPKLPVLSGTVIPPSRRSAAN